GGHVAVRVVGGYGGPGIYISPLAGYLIEHHGLTGSFVALGCLFAAVVVVAGLLLAWPPPGYTPPGPARNSGGRTPPASPVVDWPASRGRGTWQCYALVGLLLCSAPSGLLVIANADPLL